MDKLIDYTGEEVDVSVLIERLKFRQYYHARSKAQGVRVLENLHGFVCWLGHFYECQRTPKYPTCVRGNTADGGNECGSPWHFQIKAGVLLHMDGRVVRSLL